MKKLLILILLMNVYCQKKPTMQQQQKQAIENYVNAYNHFDVEALIRDLDQEVVFENISNGKVKMRLEGLNAFKEQAKAATQYFSEREQTITSWDFQDEVATIEIDYRAIWAIDLPNGMKAGDTLELKGESEFTFREGRIVVIRDKS